MAELLFTLAYVNRENDLDAINEGAFPSEVKAAIRFGVSSEYYFFSKDQPEKKISAVAISEDYFGRCNPQPNILVQGSTPSKLTIVQDIRRVLLSSRTDDPTEGDVADQLKRSSAVLSFYIRYVPPGLERNPPSYEEFSCLVAGKDYRPDTSVITYRDRISTLLADTNSMVRSFVKTSEILQAFYATAGLSLFLPTWGTYEAGPAYPIFQRFPGLIYADILFSSVITAKTPAIRDVNWLTAINTDMFARVGGPATAAAAFGPDVILHPFDGGVVFQAGPLPRLGDVNAGDIPDAYRQVARFLKPLQFTGWTPPYYLSVPDGVDRGTATQAWMNRFD